MQREILFRGKRTDNGEWVYGCVNVMQNGNAYIFRYSEQIAVDPATVGRYTGLCDKNGKKIFEGDALGDKDHENVTDKVVVFNAPSYILRDSNGYYYWHYHADDYEVIGNVIDNPELLEATQCENAETATTK